MSIPNDNRGVPVIRARDYVPIDNGERLRLVQYGDGQVYHISITNDDPLCGREHGLSHNEILIHRNAGGGPPWPRPSCVRCSWAWSRAGWPPSTGMKANDYTIGGKA